MGDFISQKTGTVLIVIVVILLNFYLMGSHGGRGEDYIDQQGYYANYVDDHPYATPMTIEQLQAALEQFRKDYPPKTPAPTPK